MVCVHTVHCFKLDCIKVSVIHVSRTNLFRDLQLSDHDALLFT